MRASCRRVCFADDSPRYLSAPNPMANILLRDCSGSRDGWDAISKADLPVRVPKGRCRMHLEPHGTDRGSSFEKGSGNPVHAIHHPSIGSEDDRKPGIHFSDPTHMVHHSADGWIAESATEPVVRVHFSDGSEGHLDHGEFPTEFDQPVDIPGIQSVLAGPKVVLLAHGCDSCRCVRQGRPRTPT
jgi:hypothetical protein